ncbi:MAG: hypothetical protein R3D00_21640 [Bacteroidia bacterium]
MKNTFLIQAIIMLFCLGGFSSEIWAQSTTTRSKADFQAAPSVNPSLNKSQSNSASDIKYAQKAAVEANKMQARLDKLTTPPKDEATLRALKAEMDANRSNANYDMARSFQLLKGSPLIIYPFKTFDADFPLVIRTGDKDQDAINYNLAKETWAARKNQARMNPSKTRN